MGTILLISRWLYQLCSLSSLPGNYSFRIAGTPGQCHHLSTLTTIINTDQPMAETAHIRSISYNITVTAKRNIHIHLKDADHGNASFLFNGSGEPPDDNDYLALISNSRNSLIQSTSKDWR